MTAVELRLCDEDREQWGGPEWVRFDENDLDDIPWQKQYEWEIGDFGLSIDFVMRVDWPARTARGKVCAVWLARTMAGVETPPLKDFKIKTGRKSLLIRAAPKAGDADPPDDAPSSTEDQSQTDSD